MMTTEPTDELTKRILEATAFNNCDDVFWRTDNEYAPITFFVMCNDLFAWGLADAERITAENIDTLEQAYRDSNEFGGVLFCCRVRGMRPQGAYYKFLPPEDKPLFDACGPVRQVDMGNPHDQKEYG